MPSDYMLARNSRKLGPEPKHKMGEASIPLPSVNKSPHWTDAPAHPEDIKRPAYTGMVIA